MNNINFKLREAFRKGIYGENYIKKEREYIKKNKDYEEEKQIYINKINDLLKNKLLNSGRKKIIRDRIKDIRDNVFRFEDYQDLIDIIEDNLSESKVKNITINKFKKYNKDYNVNYLNYWDKSNDKEFRDRKNKILYTENFYDVKDDENTRKIIKDIGKNAFFANSIKESIKHNPNNYLIKIRLINLKDGHNEWRTLSKSNIENIQESLNKILENPDNVDIFGSDTLVIQDYSFDYDVFKIINIKKIKGGCLADYKYKCYKSDNLTATSYKSTNDNCLIEIFRQKDNSLKSYNLRKKLELTDGKLSLIDDMYKLNNHFDYGCVVYKDEIDDNGKLIKLYENIKENNINILYKDDHFMEITKIINHNIIKKKKHFDGKKKQDYEFLFFDYETVSNSEGELIPYFLQIRHDNTDYYVYEDNIDSKENKINNYFMKVIRNIYKLKKKKILLIGYNSSRFDNFLILKSLINNDTTPNILYANNSILKLTTSIIDVFDLCRYTTCSLMKASNDFKLVNKKIEGFDHSIPQREYFKSSENLNKWINNNLIKLKEYAKYDVLALEELFNKVRQSVKDITQNKIDIIDKPTIAGTAFNYFKETLDKDKEVYSVKNEKIKNNETGEEEYLYNFIRGSLTAGRAEMFEVCNIKEDIIVIDATSLYPFVMNGGNEFINCEYPNIFEKPIYTDKYIDGKCGFYYCDIIKQPSKNIYPYRSKNNPLNWKYEGKMNNICLNNVDIDCIIKHNGIINIKNGIYWENSTKTLFNEYIKVFKSEKQKQDELKEKKDDNYNPAIREMCKLFLNSLSGKVIQKLNDDMTILTKDEDEFIKFVNTYEISDLKELNYSDFYLVQGKNLNINKLLECNKIPHYIGCFIYAYARRWMYDNVISKYDGYGMDTDSYFFKKSEYDKLMKESSHIMGSEFGLFKVENYEGQKNKRWNDNYFVCPKVYALYSEKEEDNKTRFKGLKMNDRLFNNENEYLEFNQLENNNLKFVKYESMEKVSRNIKDNIFVIKDVYKKIINGEDIYVVSNLLVKKKLKLSNIYITKKINIKILEDFDSKDFILDYLNK